MGKEKDFVKNFFLPKKNPLFWYNSITFFFSKNWVVDKPLKKIAKFHSVKAIKISKVRIRAPGQTSKQNTKNSSSAIYSQRLAKTQKVIKNARKSYSKKKKSMVRSRPTV